MTGRIAYRCPECGTTDVGNDATSVWSVEAQDWVLGATYDQCWCNDCGEISEFEEFDPDDAADLFVKP